MLLKCWINWLKVGNQTNLDLDRIGRKNSTFWKTKKFQHCVSKRPSFTGFPEIYVFTVLWLCLRERTSVCGKFVVAECRMQFRIFLDQDLEMRIKEEGQDGVVHGKTVRQVIRRDAKLLDLSRKTKTNSWIVWSITATVCFADLDKLNLPMMVQLSLLPQLHPKMEIASKVVKIDSKLIILLHWSKSLKITVLNG